MSRRMLRYSARRLTFLLPQTDRHLDRDVPAGAAVAGQRPTRWGEAVTASVVPLAGPVADSEALVAALRAVCARELANFKRPKRYVVLDALPRTAAGKVLKRALVARAGANVDG